MQGKSIAAHQRGPKRSLGSPQERWNCLVWLVHMHCWHECNMQPHNCITLQDGICIHPRLYRSIMYISPLRMECINHERCAARKDNGHANQKRQENNWKWRKWRNYYRWMETFWSKERGGKECDWWAEKGILGWVQTDQAQCTNFQKCRVRKAQSNGQTFRTD